MLSPISSSSASMDIESAAPLPTPKPLISRRSLLISALVLTLLLVTLITTLAITLRHTNTTTTTPPSPSSDTTTTYRTLGRTTTTTLPNWQLDTTTTTSQHHSHQPTTSALDASRAAATDVHHFQWSFPPRNQQWLDTELEALSQPDSPRYGQWASFQALMERVGPTAEEKAAVVGWLVGGGVDGGFVEDHGDVLSVTTTVGTVESLFDTTLHYHHNDKTGQTGTVSAGDVKVPASLSVNQLHGVYNFPHPIMHIGTHRSQGGTGATPQPIPAQQHDMQPLSTTTSTSRFHTLQTEETNQHCTANVGYYALVSPQFLASAYNYPLRNTSTGASGTSAIVTAFGTQAYSQADLAHQQGNIGFSQPFTPNVYNAAGNAAELSANGAGDEANLDIQVLYQISPTSNNSFYGTNTAGSQSLLQTLTAIAALPASYRPQVISISYSFGVSDYNYYHSSDGTATESKLQQLATLGVTVVVSAGDDGTSGSYNRQCSTAPNSLGYGTVSPIATTTFLPQYPASSAYVLSVGETDFLASAQNSNAAFGAFSSSVKWPAECDNCPTDQQYGFMCQATNLGEEVVSLAAKNNITGQTSGGGISSVFAVPSWQQANVSSYLTTKCAASTGCTLPPSSYYTATNRGYPDVTIFGGQFGITLSGQQAVLAGTSVAAPIWAGIIARLNEVQLARKGTTLGLVNPLFYTMATAQPATFHDLVSGENTCPQGNDACQAKVQWNGGSTSCVGWRGAVGWDPVYGLGSPNVGNIISYLQSH